MFYSVLYVQHKHNNSNHKRPKTPNETAKMDLGFGSNNQAVGAATAKVLLQGVQAQEQAIEDEMSRFDSLLDDEDALQELRRKRLAQMQSQHAARQKWKDLGHGEYKDIAGGTNDGRDVVMEFFNATKESERYFISVGLV